MSLFAKHRHLNRIGKYVHSVLFGRSNLLLTNSLISAAMGALGDSIQQHYDIMTNSLKNKDEQSKTKYCYIRTLHMTGAGFTTGLVSHYWYIYLDKYLGTTKSLKIITKKVLYDQILFSPVNLLVYFVTLGILERSGIKRIKDELIEKGFEQIYVAEWLIWPPAQYFNFYILPLRYRILFDNIISLGFDIYSPFVKYKTQLRSEKNKSDNN